jgi:hypothetical protein
VRGASPVTALSKLAAPVPSTVFALAVVGLALRLQQTPFAVMADPPSFATTPPEPARFAETPVTAFVAMEGATAAGVANVASAPYDVPPEFTAKARTR